jgi:replicative DNA helicase
MTDRFQEALDLFAHSPQRAAAGYVQLAKDLRRGRGVDFGVPSLDAKIIPARAGKVVDVIARPGHGKTSLMVAMARREALKLVDLGEEDKYVAYISWETPVEELDAGFQNMPGYDVSDLAWGRVPEDSIVENSLTRVDIPVWIFGYSLYQSSFDTPPMTVERVYEAIEGLYRRTGMRPQALFVDYIQRIPVPSEKERYMQVTSAARLIRRLGTEARCPVFLGVQANQRIDDRHSPIPSMRDAEWSAAITQDADTVLGLWRPSRTHLIAEHPYIEVGGKSWRNTEELLIIRLLKQRWESGSGIFGVNFHMPTLTLSEGRGTAIEEDDILF